MKSLVSIIAFAIVAVLLPGCASPKKCSCSAGALRPPANSQDATRDVSAQAIAAPNAPAGRVDVLSVLIGGTTAPKIFYRTFDLFLRDSLTNFTKGGGTVRTEFVFAGWHLLQLWTHAARVKAGKADVFASGTRRKCRRTMRRLVEPFLAAHPAGRIVLGGHSIGTLEMQCLKEMVERKYGRPVVAAAYALAPPVRRLDPNVAAVSGQHDFTLTLSDILYPGRAVRGTRVTVPGLDHFMVHNSPEARKVLAEYFASVARQLQDSTNHSGGSPPQ